MLSLGLGAERFHDREAVHAGHLVIQHHEVRHVVVDHPERLRAACRLADRVLILLQRANDHRERVRLVINHQDVKAALRDRRLEGVRRDKRLQGGARFQDEFAALIRAEDIESGPALQGQGAGLALDVRDEVVVVARIVVGQCDPPHAGRRGNLHHVVVRAVPPGFLWAVLLGRVLGVVDHEVGVGHKFGVPAVSFVQDGLDTARLGAGAPKLIGEWLVVHQVRHRHAVGFDSVAHRHGQTHGFVVAVADG